MSLLPSATKLRQGNVFTPVCDSVHRGGGSLSRGSLCPEWVSLSRRGLCPGGSVSRAGGSLSRGVSIREQNEPLENHLL